MHNLFIDTNIMVIVNDKTFVVFAVFHRWRKGWGYGAAAPPDFKGTPHKILIFTIEIFSLQYISPT